MVLWYGTTESGEDYWELVNSYSDQWGTRGYIKLARNTDWDQYGGQNGILSKPSWIIPDTNLDE